MKFVPALESINFQNKVYFQDLTAYCYELKESALAKLPVSKHVNDIQESLIDRFKLNVKVEVTTKGNAISSMYLKNQSKHGKKPSISFTKKDFFKLADFKQALGIVNLEQAYVTGFFSDLSVGVYLPIDIITDKKVTPEQIAALILNEIGKIFSYFECLGMYTLMELSLSSIYDTFGKGKPKEIKYALLTSFQTDTDIKLGDIDNLASLDDPGLVAGYIHTLIENNVRLQLKIYDHEVAILEHLADQFVVRMGGGAALANYIYNNYKKEVFVKNVKLFGIHFLGSVIQGLIIASGIVSGNLLMMVLIGQSTSTVSKVYRALSVIDSNETAHPLDRVELIRLELIKSIKDLDLDTAEIEDYLNELTHITNTFKKSNYTSYFEFFFKISGLKKVPTTAKELEQLANNNLFINAAQLKTLA